VPGGTRCRLRLLARAGLPLLVLRQEAGLAAHVRSRRRGLAGLPVHAPGAFQGVLSRVLRGHGRLAGLVPAPADAAGLELAVVDALHQAPRAALDARPHAALLLQDELDLPRRGGAHRREG
jgi:hypothetical protein